MLMKLSRLLKIDGTTEEEIIDPTAFFYGKMAESPSFKVSAFPAVQSPRG
jgi:hypothetical protein